MSGKVGDNLFRASGVIAAAAAGGGVSWQDVETGTTFTAVAGNGYPVNTTSNACTVTLPASASVGDEIIFTDYLRTWGTNALTINQNSLKYQGNATPNPVYDTDGESVHIVYVDVTQGWVPTYDGAVALETSQAYDSEYLIVAGGAAGGEATTGTGYGRGGGGGGGMRTNFGGTALGLTPGVTYTITVGTGGNNVTDDNGEPGVDSSISGSDITTITSTGGGFGGGESTALGAGGDGGTGGGSGGVTNPAVLAGGSGNTPSTTPSQGADGGSGTDGMCGGGGGGGASGIDGVAGAVAGGQGGSGTANSITGSSVTYAGGGGGGSSTGSEAGAGGGGKGYSHSPASAATSGTDGLGGGGGGGSFSAAGGSYPVAGDGGNGIIILRVATADVGTPSGEDSSAVDGADTVITWLATGSYVA